MIDETFASLGNKIGQLHKTLSGPDLTKMSHAVAVQAQGDAAEAVQATLPKGGFPNWRPGKMIELKTRVVDAGVGKSVLLPAGGSAGPWTVAESGRHPQFGPKITSGGKSGKRKVSRARVKRYNGETEGKHTATIAHQKMAQHTAARMQVQYEARVTRIFGR